MGLWFLQGLVVGVAFMGSAADAQTDSSIEGAKLAMHDTNRAIAGTIVGGLSFMIVLCWATLASGQKIQKIAWTTIGSTISIFCAVLVFQEFHHLVKTYAYPFAFGIKFVEFLFTLAHFIFWAAVALGVFKWRLGLLFKAFQNITDSPNPTYDDYEQRKYYRKLSLDVACVAELSGHLLGFAAINAFATFQYFFFHATYPALFATMISFIVMWLCKGLATVLLRNEMSQLDRSWHAILTEAENDVATLTVSFMIMQCIRLHITGCLPNEEGIEEDCPFTIYDHNIGDKMQMLIALVISMILAFVLTACQQTRIARQDMCKRLSECSAVAFAMLFAWSLYYSSQMFLAGCPWFNLFPNLEGENMLLAVVTALSVTASGFVLVVVLGYLADHIERFNFPRAFRTIMKAVGIAIGLSWEKCFDEAVDVISDSPGWRFILCMCCVFLLVPAWRLHIKPFLEKEGWSFGYLWQIPDAEWSRNLQRVPVGELNRRLYERGFHIQKF